MVQWAWHTILWIPVYPEGKYRVKYARPGQYLSRRFSAHKVDSLQRAIEKHDDEAAVVASFDDFPAEELYDKGRLLERGRRLKDALYAYQEVVRRYPLTDAGKAAVSCIARVRKKIRDSEGT
jgi:hypothetical protein